MAARRTPRLWCSLLHTGAARPCPERIGGYGVCVANRTEPTAGKAQTQRYVATGLAVNAAQAGRCPGEPASECGAGAKAWDTAVHCHGLLLHAGHSGCTKSIKQRKMQ